MWRNMVFVSTALFIVLFWVTPIVAEGVDIFGYSQISAKVYKDLEDDSKKTTSSISVQELDIFLQKTFTPTISALFDLQFTGSYSTSKSWGNLALDQAWVKFSPSQLLNIRVGKVTPIFNNFNEIKTRFPLFPYISRPLVYETTYQEALMLSKWVPENAMLQINGTARLKEVKLDYAMYAGNSEFINSTPPMQNLNLAGDDTTDFKLVGARLGIRSHGVKFGVSGTYDYTRNDFINQKVVASNITIANLNASHTLPFTIPSIPELGAVPRARFGTDLSYTGHGLTIEGEYILVKEFPDNDQKSDLKAISDGTTIPAGVFGPNPVRQLGTDLTKSFWYVNIMYDFLEKFYASVGASTNTDMTDLMIQKNGVQGLYFCFGYRMTDNITLKSSVTNIRNDLLGNDAVLKLNQISPEIALSIFF